MEKHLDKFIKDKLSKQRFSFDDEAWENMETILDSDAIPSLSYQKKSPKLYKVAGFLCLLVLCYTICMFSMKKRSKQHVEIVELVTPVKNTNTTIEKRPSPDQELDKNNKSYTSKDLNSKEPPAILQQASGNSIAYQEPIDNSILDKKAPASRQVVLPSDANRKQIDKRTSIILSDALSAIEETGIIDNVFTPDITQATAKNAAPTNSILLANRNYLIPKLSIINTRAIPSVEFETNTFPGPTPTKSIKILNEKSRPLLGAYIASQNFDSDRSYQLGLHGQYFLGNKISISLEPGYVYRSLEVASVAKDSSEFVSFGANTYEQDIVGQSVHSIQVPLYLNYALSNKFRIAAGLSYNRVLALGALKETRIDGVVTEQKEIWFDKEFYTNDFYRSHLSASYAFHAHASLDVQYELPFKKTALFNEESSIGLRLKIYL